MPHFRFRACLASLAWVVAMPAMAAQSSPPVLQLTVHQQQPMQLPSNLERIAIADPSVADLVTLGSSKRSVLLVGKSPGHTTLLLWLRGQKAPQRYELDVRSAVQAKLMDGQGAQLTTQNGTSLLSGSSPSMLSHQHALAAAGSDAKHTLDASTIATSPVVQVDVKVVELNKTAMRQIGINFAKTNGNFTWGFGPERASGGGAISSAFNLVYNRANSLLADIHLLETNGMARVLAKPSLVALSGQSASFLAGGELPIPQPQGLGTTSIVYKPFGIGLTVTPTVLSKDRIALKVAPEVSDLDYNNALVMDDVKVPAITTRRADTTVELGDGESFVIGGLVSRSTISSVSKVPLLGSIPILGVFFRDLNYKQVDKELVIIVTPHLVKPIAKGTPLPLPGQHEIDHSLNVWGAWLLGPASGDQLPGFSRY